MKHNQSARGFTTASPRPMAASPMLQQPQQAQNGGGMGQTYNSPQNLYSEETKRQEAAARG